MTKTASLGFPRFGAQRELKFALESYWKKESSEEDLLACAAQLKNRAWKIQQEAGIDFIPSNDFSLYDHILDLSICFNIIPKRFQESGAKGLDLYFLMARGKNVAGHECAALEMTKWFDTNYHYLVPEINNGSTLALKKNGPLQNYLEAKALGIETRPSIVGPVTFLSIAKGETSGDLPLQSLESLVKIYAQMLSELGQAGVKWVQIDEPILGLELSEIQKTSFKKAYALLNDSLKNSSNQSPQLLLTTYFSPLEDNFGLLAELPVAGWHIDLVRAPEQFDAALKLLNPSQCLSLGLVDGRNIWRSNLDKILETIDGALEHITEDRLIIASSCSLIHVPDSLKLEAELGDELKSWLSFAQEKVEELATLGKLSRADKEQRNAILAPSRKAWLSRQSCTEIHRRQVQDRLLQITPAMSKRSEPYAVRAKAQQERLKLPLFPTTTIGSFPQTDEIRSARAAMRSGKSSLEEYQQFIDTTIADMIQRQEKLGLDMLVHGEPERNDMVEFFGENLSGFAATRFGWVQSYGSRCVKPPIIFGDIFREKAMTVREIVVAKRHTDKAVKGMLTGPITILKWSFVRDDQPWSTTAQQIALAIRDEVCDLEAAGVAAIQIDEPAIREALPLRRSAWRRYLDWAVDAFKLSTSGVRSETQIHTHMCYSEFGDIIDAIAALDADVISIETSRSRMELLNDFAKYNYPNEIGPGVYDIHSPRLPTTEEMIELLIKASQVIPAERLWVNPDCGLKTRAWPEVEEALKRMVEAAQALRQGAKA